MMYRTNLGRRRFLKGMAGSAVIPPFFTGSASASRASKELRVAAIGLGGSRGQYSRGGNIARQAFGFGRVVAVSGVDRLHNDEFAAWCKCQLNSVVEIAKY